MAEPFLGEIKLIGFTFAPRDWAECKGQSMTIDQAQSLYSLLGVQFGGDGRTNFCLPDMRGRVPVHPEYSIAQGQAGGAEDSYLAEEHLPAHTHAFYAANIPGNKQGVGLFGNCFLAQPDAGGALPIYGEAQNLVALDNAGIESSDGGGGAHDNIQPSLVIRYAIALSGVYPSRS